MTPRQTARVIRAAWLAGMTAGELACVLATRGLPPHRVASALRVAGKWFEVWNHELGLPNKARSGDILK